MKTKNVWLAAANLAALATGAEAQTTTQPSSPTRTEATPVEEIVVTAAPFALSADALTANLQVLDRDELDVSPAQGIGDILNGLPGVRSTFFGPGASRPVIRGLAGPRVQVLTNGIGAIDVSAVSPDHQVAVDPQEAERIEVLQGPSTLLYGGSAIGGVVNVIDERVPTRAAVGGVDGRVSLQGSSVDEGRAVSGGIKIGEGPFVFTLDGLTRESDDYDIPSPQISQRLADALGIERGGGGATVVNSALELDQYGAGASYLFGDGGFIGAAVKRTQTNYGVVAEEEVTIDLEQTRYDLRGELPIASGFFDRARFTGAYGDYEHTEFEGDEVGTVFLTEGYEGRLEFVQRERGDLNGAVGVQFVNREFEAVGEEAYVPGADISEIAAFTLQRVDRDTYGFEGGLRVDRRELETDFASADFTSVSASVGVFTRPAEGTYLGLTLSRNERAPNEVELFANGPHVATGAFEIGNADFETEKAYSIEGAAHYELGRLSFDAHVFFNKYDGFIDLRPTGEVFDEAVEACGTPAEPGEGEEGAGEEEEALPCFLYEQTGAEFYGGEAEIGYAVYRENGREVRLEGELDYVRGDTDLGAPARIPPYAVTGRIVYQSDLLEARLEARHLGEQDRVADFELPTESYTLVNAFASVGIPSVEGASIFAEVRNIGDEEAREHASFLKDIAPLPGRNFRLGLAYRF